MKSHLNIVRYFWDIEETKHNKSRLLKTDTYILE